MDTTALPRPAVNAVERFSLVFYNPETTYTSSMGVAWAPGRVNLIGEHTDYNDGFVLPVAVDQVAAFAGRARADGRVHLWSEHFQEYALFSLAGLPATFEQQLRALPGWARYVLAVAAELSTLGVPLSGFEAVLGGDVPLGGGMSSSAALEIATAQCFALFSRGKISIGAQGATMTPMKVAALCQAAEHVATGVRTGILDQAASCLGRPGQAIFLDCRSLVSRYIPFDTPDLRLVVIDSSVRHELANTAYNERRRQCEEATASLRELILLHEPDNKQALDIKALRDVTPEQFERYKQALPDVLRRRAGYVIAEDARVLRVVELLEQGNVEAVGPILWQGHAGLRDDYEISCVEMDVLVEIAQQVPGVLGGRMMGGGFGGCTVNLVRSEAVDALRRAVEQQYQRRTGRQASIDICRAAGGPGYGFVD
jgi:galactokinase